MAGDNVLGHILAGCRDATRVGPTGTRLEGLLVRFVLALPGQRAFAAARSSTTLVVTRSWRNAG
jgi:hypothetical protein